MSALALTSFVVTVEDSAIAVALPSLGRELGLDLRALEWVVNAYTVAIAILLLSGGRLADALGHRRTLLAGLGIFTGASLVAGLAPTGAILIASRAVQGAGAALIIPATLAMVVAFFPDDRRGVALGAYAGAGAAGLALGPLVGAIVSEALGWEWIFLLNVPLGVAGLLVAVAALPRDAPRRSARGLDVPGMVASAVGLLLLVFALTTSSGTGSRSFVMLAMLAGSALAFTAFVSVERRAEAPLLAPGTFRSRRTSGSNLTMLLSTSVMCSVFFFISLYLQTVAGYSPLRAGLTFLPMTAFIVAVAPAAGRLSDRVGPRLPTTGGLLLLAVGLGMLAQLEVEAALGLLVPALAIVGIGVGLSTTPVTAAALEGLPEAAAGVAAGILNTSRMIGLTLGIALMGAIMSASWPGGLADGDVPPDDFVAGLATAFWVNTGIAIITAVIAAALLPGRRCTPHDRPDDGLATDASGLRRPSR